MTGARDNPLLWNLMRPIAGGPDGSFYFDQPNLLDQFLVNKNMAAGDAAIKADVDSVVILRPLPDHDDGHRKGLAVLLERVADLSQHRLADQRQGQRTEPDELIVKSLE